MSAAPFDLPFGLLRKRLVGGSLSDAQKLTAIVMLVSTLAWWAMVMGHSGCSHAAGTGGLPSMSWLSGWLIMVVAMMLPPALPFLKVMQRVTFGLPRGGAMVALAAVVFVVVWTVAGLVLVTTGHLVNRAAIPWLIDRPVISGLAAILIGAYQLSPLKQACLTACRSPVALMLVAWNEQHPWRSTLAIGGRYAAVCIGCCWTLMLLTWVVGALVLPLMVVISVIMLLERLLPSVRPLIPLQAALACAIGVLLLLGSLPPGLNVGKAEILHRSTHFTANSVDNSTSHSVNHSTNRFSYHTISHFTSHHPIAPSSRQ